MSKKEAEEAKENRRYNAHRSDIGDDQNPDPKVIERVTTDQSVSGDDRSITYARTDTTGTWDDNGQWKHRGDQKSSTKIVVTEDEVFLNGISVGGAEDAKKIGGRLREIVKDGIDDFEADHLDVIERQLAARVPKGAEDKGRTQ